MADIGSYELYTLIQVVCNNVLSICLEICNLIIFSMRIYEESIADFTNMRMICQFS